MNIRVTADAPREVLRSAKRGRVERKGVHAWHPYYAGYSEQFVESGLDYLGSRPGDLILDPWGGSGTTGLIASRRQLDSLCLDINPVMATFAAAKAHAVLEGGAKIDAWLKALPDRARIADCADEPLTGLFDGPTAADLRAILRSIPFAEHGEGHAVLMPDASAKLFDPLHAFCRAVVFVTLRRLSGTQKLQNPTWLRTEGANTAVDGPALRAALRENAERMLDDLQAFYGEAGPEGALNAALADTRAMPLRDQSVDAIITSPPYLTRIDYAVSTLPEMMTFGDETHLQTVRHQTMGAPVITKIERRQRPEWGPLCNGVLDAVKSHDTKAAASYYWKNIIQYFMDMDASLQELKRVLKPGGRALVVVQSSYFKEVEIPLGDIYVQAGLGLGLKAGVAAREPVKTHMAHVNTKSNQYKANKVYFEDVVELVRVD